MTSPYDDVIEGQSKLIERYEEALKAIFDDPHELPRQWALYGLTGGPKPIINGVINRKNNVSGEPEAYVWEYPEGYMRFSFSEPKLTQKDVVVTPLYRSWRGECPPLQWLEETSPLPSQTKSPT